MAMERAGRSLSNLKLSASILPESLACAAWATAVGKRIAAHSTATTLVRDKLVVEVEDAIWQKQLFHLRYQILKRLREVSGNDLIGDLEFRIGVPRRPAQVAQHISTVPDEADRIGDGALRILYKQARKKATA